MFKNQPVTEFSLFGFCGEFCTERKNTGILKLSKVILSKKSTVNSVLILRAGVKMMSASFVDEFVKTLLSLGLDRNFIKTKINFEPKLESIYSEQIDRSLASRS